MVLQILGSRMAADDWSITAHMDIVIEVATARGLDLKLAEIVRLVDSGFDGGGWQGGGESVDSVTDEQGDPGFTDECQDLDRFLRPSSTSARSPSGLADQVSSVCSARCCTTIA